MKFFLIIVLSFASSLAFAKMNFMEVMRSNYPSVQTSKLNDCMTCHTIDKWQRNSFGTDLEIWLRTNYPDAIPSSQQYTQEMIQQAFVHVKDLDSDKDGFTNQEEFEKGTFPGDALDY